MFLLFFTSRNVKRCALAYATTKNAPFLNRLKASFRMLLLLRSLTVAAHELIDTTCGVNEFALTSIERVRGA